MSEDVKYTGIGGVLFMNKTILKLSIYSSGTVAALVGLAAYLVAPDIAPREKCAPFIGRNYAHRGLHNIEKSVPENSLPAFADAALMGYGIELDVHITQDGQLLVFHDDNTKRICGVDYILEKVTWEELSKLKLCGTDYRIPLLSEVLGVVGTQCPVIIELKRGGRNRELCEKTYAMMKEYGGIYCVESFDPRIVHWFRRNAPEVLRGQLASDPHELAKDTKKLNAFIIGNLLSNVFSRPNFVSYGMGSKPLLAKLSEKMGAMKVAWVSRDNSAEKQNDAVIFEHYNPEPKYK